MLIVNVPSICSIFSASLSLKMLSSTLFRSCSWKLAGQVVRLRKSARLLWCHLSNKLSQCVFTYSHFSSFPFVGEPILWSVLPKMWPVSLSHAWSVWIKLLIHQATIQVAHLHEMLGHVRLQDRLHNDVPDAFEILSVQLYCPIVLLVWPVHQFERLGQMIVF